MNTLLMYAVAVVGFLIVCYITIPPIVLDAIIRINMTDENTYKAKVIDDNGKKKFYIEGLGVKEMYNEFWSRYSYSDSLNIGEKIDVYWFGLMDNWVYRLVYKGAIPTSVKKNFSILASIFASVVFIIILFAYLIAFGNI